MFKNFKCNLCDKSFAYNHQYEATNHKEGEREKFKCNLCGKELVKNNTSLQLIKLVNEKVKEFKCDLFQKEFALNKDLQNHKRIIHDVTFNQFKCVFCYMDYAYEQSLKEHKSAKHDGKDR